MHAVCVDFPLRGRDKRTHAALKDVSFFLKSGDRLGISGPNGSGKSTLLRVLTGIYPPTSGRIVVQGSVASMLDLHAGINGKSTGRESILYRSKLLGRSKQTALATVEDACEFGELAEFIDQPVESYSSGMRMRLAFSIATSVPAEILVMDEWLSVGDQGFRDKARARIAGLVADSRILVLASHNKELLSSHCNRFLTLERGVATLSDTI